MSKTFREGYYEDDGLKIKKLNKTNKQKRQRVRDYLRQIELGGVAEEDEEFDLDETEIK